MNSVIGVIIVLTILGVLFFLMGHCFCGIFRKKERVTLQILLGAVVFFAVFSVIELPIEKLDLPFHVMVYAELAGFVRSQLCVCVSVSGRECFAKEERGYSRTP